MHQNNDQSTNNTNNQQQTNKKQLKGTQLANFTPVAHIDSLQTTDTAVGTGAEVQPSSTVTVDYTGAIASNGIVFESSLDTGQPASFPLSGVIKGWQEGLVGAKAGGTRRLLIPAALAYGAQGNSSIPPNSDLVFDVHIISLK
jgi:peptidylprolyl isomerase